MSDFRDGVHSQQPDLLSQIRQELQVLNTAFSGFSTQMQKVYGANQKSEVRQEKFETYLKKFFTSTQETGLRRKAYETDQLKTLVDINKQILKESQKSSEAIKRFQEVQRSKEYQNAGRDIANEYHKAMRKEHGSHVMGTLAHHFGQNYSGIGALLSRIPGLDAFSPHKAPGDFLHQKKAREQGLYNNAMRSFEDLNTNARGSSSVDNYGDMRGTEKALNDKVMDSLKAQAEYLTDNYTKGYRRRAGRGGKNTPLFGGPTALEPSSIVRKGTSPGGRTLSSQEQADLEKAILRPSPADVAKQTAGTANGFLLLYNFFKDQEAAKDTLGNREGGKGGGLLGGLGNALSSAAGGLAGKLLGLLGKLGPKVLGPLGLLLTAGGFLWDQHQQAVQGAKDEVASVQADPSKMAVMNKFGQDPAKADVESGQMVKTKIDNILSEKPQIYIKNKKQIPSGLFKWVSKGNGLYQWTKTSDGTTGTTLIQNDADFQYIGMDAKKRLAGGSEIQFKAGGLVPGGEETPVPVTAHGGELVLNASEVSKLRKNAVEGNGLGKDGMKVLEQLLAVNQALLDEMKRNTEATAASKEDKSNTLPPTAETPKGPSRSFQRSN